MAAVNAGRMRSAVNPVREGEQQHVAAMALHQVPTALGRPVFSLGCEWPGQRGSANDLFGIVLDANVHIQESKATTRRWR
jgi:hypothetical protein